MRGRDLARRSGYAAGAGCVVLALQRLDVRPAEAARALAVAAAFALPLGALCTRSLGRERWRLGLERLALAALVGAPLACAAVYLLSLAGAAGLAPVLALAAGAAFLLRTRRAPALPPADWDAPANGLLAALVGLVLLVTTRGLRAFQPFADGLLYDHSLEHAIHLAFSWELLRGVPPAQLPTAAGLPFPHYHVLGYMPLVLLARHGGIGLVTAYHALLPLWNLALLCGALHLVLRARAGRLATSLAALVALFFVVGVLESRYVPESFAGRAPLEFFLRMVSGSAGVLVWAAVACLLAIATDTRRRGLALAGLLAGLAYGFKAQMFVLLAPAFGLALVLLAARGERRLALRALLLMAAGCLPLALTWRSSAGLGRLSFELGAFARQAGFAAPFEAWGPAAAALVATPLALLALLRGSPLWPAYGLAVLRRWRAAPPLDLLLGLAPPVALALALGLVAQEPQPGEVSALVVREGLFALQIGGVALDVALLAALLGRRGRDGPRLVLALAAAAALLLIPLTARVTVHRSPRRAVALSAGEVGALAYLRARAPLDAVVAQARSWSKPELADVARGLDTVPVVAAFAGRRSVLEYYRPDIDPAVNRGRQLRRLFTTRDGAEGEAILERFAVDYVLEYAGRPLAFASARLQPVFAAGDVRLLRVRRPDRPAEADAPPGDLR